MRNWRIATLVLASAMLLPLVAEQINSLSLAGQTGSAHVINVHGRNFVDIDDLVRLTNGSIRINGSSIILDLSPATHAEAAQPGLSRTFVIAGIEAMAEQREWRAGLKYAIEGGYPLTEPWLSAFRDKAQAALQAASASGTSTADRNVAPLLVMQFNNMVALSDKYLQMTKSLSYIDPRSLENDPLDQKVIACNHSLSSIATASQFVDDGSCR